MRKLPYFDPEWSMAEDTGNRRPVRGGESACSLPGACGQYGTV